ncbi:hypothetical protein FEM48_Zijuj04G0130200 [Ziziphus jujuba var. spinosa]|uniref:Retrovirus-related Pol polyprotein from transposon RE1 n=1 Tax=Ziziphus jujuba var. spinosa TaxID=714518 RepID=A0A978VK15_ZIZJJ|nr:hypothetical protein FEM48_Zijuj04G0130200 [Ziziphus jujuba var. spinosa]
MADDNASVTNTFPGLPPSSSSVPTNDTLICINVAAQALVKLSASNYPLWHSQWLSLLLGYNLMAYVDGSKICPTGFTSSLSPNQFYTLRQDQLLRSSLLASLTPTIAFFVSSAKTSYETWTKLAHMYAKPSRCRIMGLRENLHKYIKGSQSISSYMQNIQQQADALALAGVPLRDDEIIFYVLASMGSKYKEIPAAIRVHDDTISFEELHDKLADFEDLLKCTSSSSNDFSSPITAHVATRSGFSSRGPAVTVHGGRSLTIPTHFSLQSLSPSSSHGFFPPLSGNGSTQTSFGNCIICQFCSIPGHDARRCCKLLALIPWLNSGPPSAPSLLESLSLCTIFSLNILLSSLVDAAIKKGFSFLQFEIEFVEVLAFRQSHQALFSKSDLFFVCHFTP